MKVTMIQFYSALRQSSVAVPTLLITDNRQLNKTAEGMHISRPISALTDGRGLLPNTKYTQWKGGTCKYRYADGNPVIQSNKHH